MKQFKLTDVRVGVPVPSWATVILSLLAGVLAYLNQETFGFAEPWGSLLTAALAAVAALGVSPAVHEKIGNLLQIPYATSLAIASVMTTAAVGLATVKMDATLRSVLVALLTVAAGALTGTAADPPLPPPLPAPTPLPAPIAGEALLPAPPTS